METLRMVRVTMCGDCGRIHEAGSRCPRCEERVVERAIIETFVELYRQAVRPTMSAAARVTVLEVAE
jgi:tRNA(Ile2) C34 agmatinyltransferase TiaS